MLRLLLFLLAFIIINTISFEYLVDRASSWLETLAALAIFITTLIYLVIKPIQKLKP